MWQERTTAGCKKKKKKKGKAELYISKWNGRRRLERPLRRLLDQAKTGLSRPNSWRIMSMMILKVGSSASLFWCLIFSSFVVHSSPNDTSPLSKYTLLAINVSPLKWLLLVLPECVYSDLHKSNTAVICTLMTYIHNVRKSNSALVV